MHPPLPEGENISARDMAMWMFVWTLGVVALIVGCVGFQLHGQEHGEHVTHLSALYMSMQMFVLHTPHLAEPIPWQLEFARFAAAFVGLYTAVRTLMVILSRQTQSMLLRVVWGHVVVCGLGRKGLELARSFRRAGRRVVVVDSQETNEFIGAARAAGAMVVVGDARSIDILRSVGANRARWLIASTGEDGHNIDIAVHAWQLARRRWSVFAKLRCFVHLVNPDLREELKHHRVLADPTDLIDTRPFNIYDSGARDLFDKHPLDYVSIGPTEQRVVHLIVIGIGQMGEAVLIQAVKIGHFAHGLKLRVTVLNLGMDKRQRVLLQRYPQLSQVCDIEFLEGDAEDPQTLDGLAKRCRPDEAIPYVAVCFDNDSRAITCALRLERLLEVQNIPVMVRIAADAGLATLLHRLDGDKSHIGRLRPFGMVDRMCTRRILVDDEQDRLALAIHQDYCDHRRQQGKTADNDPSMVQWEQLDEGLKDSNRQQADHISVKLRAIGRTLEQYAIAPHAFTEDEVELLAKMEHARWNAERFLAGWRFDPTKDNARKRSPYLVEWDRLPEEIKEYDREAVRNIPKLFRKSGDPSRVFVTGVSPGTDTTP